MKKFILPVINLISIVLSAVVFGLGANSAVYRGVASAGQGNWYQLVWTIAPQPTLIGLLGFFLFVFAVFFALVTMIPFKGRKFAVCAVGLMFVTAGIMFLLTPGSYFDGSAAAAHYIKTDSYIAMAVLVFVAGGLELLGSAVEFLPEKKSFNL